MIVYEIVGVLVVLGILFLGVRWVIEYIKLVRAKEIVAKSVDDNLFKQQFQNNEEEKQQ